MTDLKDIQKLIDESGNSFHYRVVDALRAKGWNVDVSPYYNDNQTDKPREIDIIAEKRYVAHDSFSGRGGNIVMRLFIECKYISSDTVFWFDNKDTNQAKNSVMQNTPLDPHWSNITSHHYLNKESESVAKLFTSNNARNQDNDTIYKALNQSLNAMVYYKNRETSISRNDELGRLNILYTLNYPVIICNSFDKFYKLDTLDKTTGPVKIGQNFQLETNYAYIDNNKKNVNEYFLIDVVDISKLDYLIADIENKDLPLIREKLCSDMS